MTKCGVKINDYVRINVKKQRPVTPLMFKMLTPQ